MFVYAIVENGKLYPNAFTNYKDALDEVKKKYEDWNDNEDNEVDVEEGTKLGNKKNGDPNITELYIEKGIHIFIHKLPLNSPTLGGRRYRKKNASTKKSNK